MATKLRQALKMGRPKWQRLLAASLDAQVWAMLELRPTSEYAPALIRSGGGNRPGEARQPPVSRPPQVAGSGTVPIPLRWLDPSLSNGPPLEKMREGGRGVLCPSRCSLGKGNFAASSRSRWAGPSWHLLQGWFAKWWRYGGQVGYAKGLVCRECGELYDLAPLHVCELCFGPLEVTYDYAAMRASISREEIERGPKTVWRYRTLLPVGDAPLVDIQTGCTPLIKAENLGRVLGLHNLYVKNDTVNPTFSFKDRPVTVAATMARAFGFDTIACASTGNLAAAVAAHAASAEMRCIVFIPGDLEPSKITNIAVYGPTLVAIRGNYDDVNRLCAEIADRYGWAFVNINLRPYYAEGSKTLAFEVAEQLGWRAPDTVIVPTASGALFTKIRRGFEELVEVGLIPAARPRMGLAQAAGCSPIVMAHAASSMTIRPVKPSTIAKSLAIGNPADGYYCLKAIKETKGFAGSVTDEEIVEGMQLLARTEGIFGETAGGVSVGVVKKLAEAGALDPDETVVVYVTGNGLKTPEAVAASLPDPITIGASMAEFDAAIELQGATDVAGSAFKVPHGAGAMAWPSGA